MKVVEIISDLRARGGAEVFFSSLCEELAKNSRIELTIISLWSGTHPSFLTLSKLKGVEFIELSKKRGIDLKASRKLKKIIKKINPDIINTHRSVLLTYFFAFGFKKTKWKIIHTIHNTPNKEADRLTWLLRKKYERNKMIFYVGISDAITRDFLSVHKRALIRTIYNGINLRKIDSQQKKYDLICVARFSEQKNHRLLFDVFDELFEETRGINLICVGTGELLKKSKDYVDSLSCRNNVTFYGATSDVYPLLLQSKIFVLSSLYEGNPISILEAMNCGLPIVAPRVGGIPDVVKDKKNGLLFDVGSKNEMKKKIKLLIDNEKMQNKISEQNLKDIHKYSMACCAVEYFNYFSQLL